MSKPIATVAVPEFDRTMYDINVDAFVPVTVVGYSIFHYATGPTQTFKTDVELAESGIELRMKLSDGHWLIAVPDLKASEGTQLHVSLVPSEG